ncbi:MarR family winged helix-turn-helix transcriptional regulator [Dactylosporangium sp. CS-047395]|uniref:MarR family winged helix-turn-helix transcriptional regulator n=1 Tax=Dactylosporangium sp. CS-047395 TaxID=3239936 RepID=UPI003D8B53BC
MTEARDQVDDHVARWAVFWHDNPAFVPEVEGALVRMGQILRHMRRADAVAFADAEDFTQEDYRTLHALMVQPYPIEASPAQLADATHVTRAAMTRRLDRLVAAGLVHREVDATDRRRIIIRPTTEGRAAWNRYIFEGMARDQQLLAALSPDELLQLNALLRKVMVALD